MDVLSGVLSMIRLLSALSFCPELSAPWGIKVPAQGDRAPFWVLSHGSCYLEVDGRKTPVPLVGGDLIMLPHGTAHTLRDQLQTPAVPLDQLMREGRANGETQALRYGGGGGKSALVSGYFKFNNRTASQLIAPLPPLIHIHAEGGQSVPWLETMLRFLASESTSNDPGTQIIRARLTDVLFIQTLRAFLAQIGEDEHTCEEKGSILRALTDPQIGKALAVIHQQTNHPWTVAGLAERVNMSRTGFAVRFSKLAGVTPLDYLTKWRMEKAGDLLLQGEESLDTIAHRVGYESGAAFSKAFKREMGILPGLYRKEQVGSINSILPR
ncbi:MAG: AraC family transcriptional regulator [Armatimonadetes bacterium]|nr:AraC family transcriptional regulator [Armatimonadota bacterium]